MKEIPPELLAEMRRAMQTPVPCPKEKEKPKKKIKKIIGKLYTSGLWSLDEYDCETLAKVIWLQKEGKEIFSEIPYKCSFIEFYYYDFADCHITPQSEENGSDK